MKDLELGGGNIDYKIKGLDVCKCLCEKMDNWVIYFAWTLNNLGNARSTIMWCIEVQLSSF